jgi:hypothetical protein
MLCFDSILERLIATQTGALVELKHTSDLYRFDLTPTRTRIEFAMAAAIEVVRQRGAQANLRSVRNFLDDVLVERTLGLSNLPLVIEPGAHRIQAECAASYSSVCSVTIESDEVIRVACALSEMDTWGEESPR